MCLIAFAWQVCPRYPLALIANRDEFHARPSTAAESQSDAPQVYGGRDLEKQGSWLQVSTRRRLAAVTNVRVGTQPDEARAEWLRALDPLPGSWAAPKPDQRMPAQG